MTAHGARGEVEPAGLERLGALAPVFGRAFINEPMMRWPMGGGDDNVDRFTRCFAYFLEIALGLGLVPGGGPDIWFMRWNPLR